MKLETEGQETPQKLNVTTALGAFLNMSLRSARFIDGDFF
jgi:hypothetical protein